MQDSVDKPQEPALPIRWDKDGFGIKPDIIRFCRDAWSDVVEVEFMMAGDEQGRIWDLDVLEVMDWLRIRGIKMTERLTHAYDAAFNFPDVMYFTGADRFLAGR